MSLCFYLVTAVSLAVLATVGELHDEVDLPMVAHDDELQQLAEEQQRLLVISFVSRPVGYLKQLEQSCSQFGYELRLVGQNSGEADEPADARLMHASRLAAVQSLPERQVVILCDGWDFVFLGPASEMLARFEVVRNGRGIVAPIAFLDPVYSDVPDTWFFIGYAGELASMLKWFTTSAIVDPYRDVLRINRDWPVVTVDKNSTLASNIDCGVGRGHLPMFLPAMPCEPRMQNPAALAAHGILGIPMAPVLSGHGFDPEPIGGSRLPWDTTSKNLHWWFCDVASGSPGAWSGWWVLLLARTFYLGLFARLFVPTLWLVVFPVIQLKVFFKGALAMMVVGHAAGMGILQQFQHFRGCLLTAALIGAIFVIAYCGLLELKCR